MGGTAALCVGVFGFAKGCLFTVELDGWGTSGGISLRSFEALLLVINSLSKGMAIFRALGDPNLRFLKSAEGA